MDKLDLFSSNSNKKENKDEIDFSKFDEFQAKEIRLGLLLGLDVLTYAKPTLNFKQMEVIRHSLEKNRFNKGVQLE